jgi:hypothetical protein
VEPFRMSAVQLAFILKLLKQTYCWSSHGFQPISIRRRRKALAKDASKEAQMNKGMKIAILATAAFATVAVPLTSASADSWRGDRYRHRYHDNNSDAWAAGAVGLAAGALLGSALAQPAEPIYRDYDDGYYRRPVRVYREVAPRYYGGAQPWSPSWYRYCADRYRSFNPETGTFRGYDGRDYFCNAN